MNARLQKLLIKARGLCKQGAEHWIRLYANKPTWILWAVMATAVAFASLGPHLATTIYKKSKHTAVFLVHPSWWLFFRGIGIFFVEMVLWSIAFAIVTPLIEGFIEYRASKKKKTLIFSAKGLLMMKRAIGGHTAEHGGAIEALSCSNLMDAIGNPCQTIAVVVKYIAGEWSQEKTHHFPYTSSDVFGDEYPTTSFVQQVDEHIIHDYRECIPHKTRLEIENVLRRAGIEPDEDDLIMFKRIASEKHISEVKAHNVQTLITKFKLKYSAVFEDKSK